MHIKGSQLLYLLQVTKDSLQLPQGTDWAFSSRKQEREKFLEDFFKFLIDSADSIQVDGFDLAHLKNEN